jgi:hypothetical protein
MDPELVRQLYLFLGDGSSARLCGGRRRGGSVARCGQRPWHWQLWSRALDHSCGDDDAGGGRNRNSTRPILQGPCRRDSMRSGDSRGGSCRGGGGGGVPEGVLRQRWPRGVEEVVLVLRGRLRGGICRRRAAAVSPWGLFDGGGGRCCGCHLPRLLSIHALGGGLGPLDCRLIRRRLLAACALARQ